MDEEIIYDSNPQDVDQSADNISDEDSGQDNDDGDDENSTGQR